jgi:hypothetical protein
MTDFELILHEIIRTRGAESVVRQILVTDEHAADFLLEYGIEYKYGEVSDKQIRFESSRAAYKIAQRNKR